MKSFFTVNNILLKALAVLVLFIAIGTIYAMWSETLRINVTANTGELDAAIVTAYTSDSSPTTIDHNGAVDVWPTCENFTYNPDYNSWVAVLAGDLSWWTTDKAVAYATTLLEDTDGDGDYDKCYVKIHNAYPGYLVWFSLEVDNVGTIPLFIDYYIVNGTTLTNDQITANNLVFLDADGDCQPEVMIQLYNLLGDQIDPGDGRESSWRILVLQPAKENSEYVIVVELVAVQWNESIYYTTPGP